MGAAVFSFRASPTAPRESWTATRIRMEQAAKFLRADPPEKICDVAEKVGYVSVKHFSYVFKQQFQMTPGEYQEACRANPSRAGAPRDVP